MSIDWGEYQRQKQAEALHRYRLETDDSYRADHNRRQAAEVHRRRLLDERLAAAYAVGAAVGARVQIRADGQPFDGAVGTVVSIDESLGQLLANVQLDPVIRTTPLPKLPAFAIRRRDLRESPVGVAKLAPLVQVVRQVDVMRLRVLASAGKVNIDGSGAAG